MWWSTGKVAFSFPLTLLAKEGAGRSRALRLQKECLIHALKSFEIPESPHPFGHIEVEFSLSKVSTSPVTENNTEPQPCKKTQPYCSYPTGIDPPLFSLLPEPVTCIMSQYNQAREMLDTLREKRNDTLKELQELASVY